LLRLWKEGNRENEQTCTSLWNVNFPKPTQPRLFQLIFLKKVGLLKLQYGIQRWKTGNIRTKHNGTKALLCYYFCIYYHRTLSLFSPLFLQICFTPKKRREGNCLGYFCFFMKQQYSPMTSTTTTSIMTTRSIV